MFTVNVMSEAAVSPVLVRKCLVQVLSSGDDPQQQKLALSGVCLYAVFVVLVHTQKKQ